MKGNIFVASLFLSTFFFVFSFFNITKEDKKAEKETMLTLEKSMDYDIVFTKEEALRIAIEDLECVERELAGSALAKEAEEMKKEALDMRRRIKAGHAVKIDKFMERYAELIKKCNDAYLGKVKTIRAGDERIPLFFIPKFC